MQTLSLTADRRSLSAFGRIIPCSCEVVNEFTTPARVHVVYSEQEDGSRGWPYMPRVFPSCINGIPWNVVKVKMVDPADDPNEYEQPFFISTDAWQWVEIWNVRQDHELFYDGKAMSSGLGVAGGRITRMEQDYGYGMHFSKCRWTLGCEKVLAKDDLLWLVDRTRAALHDDGGLKLLVA